ncbi:MAG: glycosyltransferase family 2 protein [Gemmatimonadota bacterium]|nr:MAG: glycosyltransferase family 2 protein [Gemmatimonadota bacterium]
MASPRVSILIPAYNAQDTIGRAIESALGQTYDPIEVIVVNDGSTDGTAAVVEGYPQVRMIHQENRGPMPARSTAAEAATGDLLALLDADDEFHPMKIALQVEILRRAPRISALFSAPCVIEGGTKYCSPHDVSGRIVFETFPDVLGGRKQGDGWKEGSSPSVVMRRELIENVGGFYRLGFSSGERDLWLRALAKGHILGTLKLPLYNYYRSEGSMSSQLVAQLERRLKYMTVWSSDKEWNDFSVSREMLQAAWITNMSRCVDRFVKYGDFENMQRAWQLLKEHGKPSMKTRAVVTWPGAARIYALLRNRMLHVYGARIYARWAKEVNKRAEKIYDMVHWGDVEGL